MVNPEIRLLGKRAEEAAQQLDEYLYNALEQGVSHVRIVHGFGTGTLRHVVQELLRHHPAVLGYRAGAQQEGGGGVTIAEVDGVRMPGHDRCGNHLLRALPTTQSYSRVEINENRKGVFPPFHHRYE